MDIETTDPTEAPEGMPDLSDERLAAQIPLRHSVRSFTDRRIEGQTRAALQRFVDECNERSGLSLALCTDEPGAFSSLLVRYGLFRNVRNYIACIGAQDQDLQERVGYWGERCVLAAQALGLNSCWVGLTYSKKKVAVPISAGQELVCVIALGYGTMAGKPHKSKRVLQVAPGVEGSPDWFRRGVEAALLAPTAVNQQKFAISLDGDEVRFQSEGGAYTKVDLGIVKAHFELGAMR
ncbi:nitroreductase family protein [Adlercreutzia aquisgranensis]|uniref:nitroreductase family protein n=1 Tax=Adlercreutzia aquisgranensis TaxID=2941323 RepID=UPI00203D5EA8|nr:nitroreductase family protein [Adlercreutzia aquisgranensis]